MCSLKCISKAQLCKTGICYRGCLELFQPSARWKTFVCDFKKSLNGGKILFEAYHPRLYSSVSTNQYIFPFRWQVWWFSHCYGVCLLEKEGSPLLSAEWHFRGKHICNTACTGAIHCFTTCPSNLPACAAFRLLGVCPQCAARAWLHIGSKANGVSMLAWRQEACR